MPLSYGAVIANPLNWNVGGGFCPLTFISNVYNTNISRVQANKPSTCKPTEKEKTHERNGFCCNKLASSYPSDLDELNDGI